VFEPRYRALVQHCLDAEEPEFGVVLIERGSEVGGGDLRRDRGTVARMVQVGEMADGRYAVVAVGTSRIRVETWLDDDPYPRALVLEWPDEECGDAGLPDAVAELAPRVRRAAALARELGDPVPLGGADVSPDTCIASYQLADLAPLGAADRYELLSTPGPRSRLAELAQRLGEVEAILQFRLGSS
jgi:Lon protease-like protein